MYLNEYPKVEIHPGGTDEFVHNQTLAKAEERMAAVAVIRPAAICKITGLN